ncbi:response regulator transcription factor [Parasalinivibrio latis]|uniref:response regulator n=1 Tax=Parasalinivibrio latis TaxID=2952610 RepID=UPI0030E3012E
MEHGCKVMIVDDHPMVRQGCRILLESQHMEICAEADSGESALKSLSNSEPDVAVVDLSMENMGGLEAISRILSRSPQTRIVVFTMHDDPNITMRAIKNGARGYVTKSSPPDVLIEAIETVMDGGSYLSTDVAKTLAFNHHLTANSDPLESLTNREFDIFQRLADGKSTSQIADDLSLSKKSVSNYVVSIKHKLNACSLADLIKFAITSGLSTRNLN